MKNFFKIIWKWLRWILLVIVIIWLLFFLLNLFFPTFAQSLESKIVIFKTAKSQSEKTKLPLRIRVYKSIFGGTPGRDFSQSANDTNSEASSSEDTNTQGIFTRNKLKATDNYIFPNTNKEHEVAPDFKFDDKLLTKDGDNILKGESRITGKISSNYISNLGFNIYIYDKNRELLYTIPVYANYNPNDYEYLEFNEINYSYYNLESYTGDGYLAIWSDNPEKENAILISKIKIEN